MSRLDLSALSDQELDILREEADIKLDIYRDISQLGFSCQPSCDVDIPGMCKVQLPYYLHLYVDADKIRLVDDVKEQQDWVTTLNFDYNNVDTSQAVVNIVDDWNWDNMSSSSGALANIMVTIYYQEGDPKSPFEDTSQHQELGDFILL